MKITVVPGLRITFARLVRVSRSITAWSSKKHMTILKDVEEPFRLPDVKIRLANGLLLPHRRTTAFPLSDSDLVQ